MSVLCAIISHAKSTRRDTIRRTWMPLVPSEVDAKFFVGALEHDEPNVTNLHCSDDHENIPDKIREICRWALQRDYMYMWKVDDDVQLVPSKLAETSSPFMGVLLPQYYPRISGFLYGFNRSCMEILSTSKIPVYRNGWDCGYYQDEYWVQDTLGRAGIPCDMIRDCKVVYHPFETAFSPIWVVAVHGESRDSRSYRAFLQLNGYEIPMVRRLRRKV